MTSNIRTSFSSLPPDSRFLREPLAGPSPPCRELPGAGPWCSCSGPGATVDAAAPGCPHRPLPERADGGSGPEQPQLPELEAEALSGPPTQRRGSGTRRDRERRAAGQVSGASPWLLPRSARRPGLPTVGPLHRASLGATPTAARRGRCDSPPAMLPLSILDERTGPSAVPRPGEGQLPQGASSHPNAPLLHGPLGVRSFFRSHRQ